MLCTAPPPPTTGFLFGVGGSTRCPFFALSDHELLSLCHGFGAKSTHDPLGLTVRRAGGGGGAGGSGRFPSSAAILVKLQQCSCFRTPVGLWTPVRRLGAPLHAAVVMKHLPYRHLREPGLPAAPVVPDEVSDGLAGLSTARQQSNFFVRNT